MPESMTPGTRWGLALEGPDPSAIVRWLAERVWPDRIPAELVIGARSLKPKADWAARLLPRAGTKDDAAAYFTAGSPDESLIVHAGRLVKARFPFEPDIDEAKRWLETAPFVVASFESLHDWSAIDKRYSAPSFGRRHFPHGWGCAFKGSGHDRLVSRRWLEFGPWRLIRGAGDLSLVQFHAFDAPPRQALAQAKPAHETMGISDEGGFLQNPYVFATKLSGLYDAAERTLRIVVTGRDVPAVEMLDARAAVKQGALTADKPLERVLYVFTKPAEARRHLHALWLRELEVWTIVDGVEQRLDGEYAPEPEPPAWTTAA
jgi:hypothetical protein